MAVGGLKFIEETLDPNLTSQSPTYRTVQLSMEIMNFIQEYTYKAGRKLHVKIGIHYGQCIFGVLGYHKPQFSLIGDTINTASRCCTTAEKGTIAMSENAWREIESTRLVSTRPMKVQMKGKDLVTVYVVKKPKKRIDQQDQKPAKYGVETRLNSNALSIQRSSWSSRNILRRGSSQMERSMMEADSIPRQDVSQYFNELEFHSQKTIDNRSGGSSPRNSSNEGVKLPEDIGNIRELENHKVQQASKVGTISSTGAFITGEAEEDNAKNMSEYPRLTKYFENKMIVKYGKIIDVCFGIFLIDLIVSEFIVWIDPQIYNKIILFRIINFTFSLIIFVFGILKKARTHFLGFKIAICCTLFLRMLINLVELIVVDRLDYLSDLNKSTRKVHLVYNIFSTTIIDCCIIVSIGIFYFWETVILNIVLGSIGVFITIFFKMGSVYLFAPVFSIICNPIYNIVDSRRIVKRETESFVRVMNIIKKSAALSKFVDRLLPKHIQDVNSADNNLADTYHNVTILFADIAGFTAYSKDREPRQVIEMLSKLFIEFDKECNRLDLFKVYTIGDCYVVLGFLDKKNRKQPQEEANDVVQLGISMVNTIATVREQINFKDLNMRIGIHTGSIYGGVIGTDIVRFDIYGPDVLIANKMESGGKEGRICVSQQTKDLLEKLETTSYTFEPNKTIKIASLKTEVNSYLLGSSLLKEDTMEEEGRGK